MTDKAEQLEVLRYARDVVLASESSWGKGVFFMDAQGRQVKGREASRFCALGACWSAKWALNASVPWSWVAAHLDEQAPGVAAVQHFNDAPDTTYEDVISLFDKAIKALEDD